MDFLKEGWVSRVKKDHWMDFVIFHDDILLGDDSAEMTKCLQYNPESLVHPVYKKNSLLGSTSSV